MTMPENGEELSTIVMMTVEEARKARDEINNDAGSYYARQRARVMEFYARKGWVALGYSNWSECVEKEFGHSRRRVYQLLDEGQVAIELESTLTGKLPALSGKAMLALKAAPAGERAEVLKQAQEEHETETPTGPQVAETTKKWKKSGAKPKKKEREATIGQQAETNEKLHKALMTIGDTCSRAFRKAIEDGTVELSKGEVIEMSEMEDDRMQEVERLVTVNRWSVKRAVKFLDQQPELTDTIDTICNLAVASLDDEWSGDFGAFTVTVKVHRRKLGK